MMQNTLFAVCATYFDEWQRRYFSAIFLAEQLRLRTQLAGPTQLTSLPFE
jgi:hypothetical protein